MSEAGRTAGDGVPTVSLGPWGVTKEPTLECPLCTSVPEAQIPVALREGNGKRLCFPPSRCVLLSPGRWTCADRGDAQPHEHQRCRELPRGHLQTCCPFILSFLLPVGSLGREQVELLRDMVLRPCCKKAEAQGACKQPFTDGSFKTTGSVSSQVCLEKGAQARRPLCVADPCPPAGRAL